jgi:hypothetical protein
MLVRLTVKLAEIVDGIDLSHCQEGDVIELPERHAQLLIREGWAQLAADDERRDCTPEWRPDARSIAAERRREKPAKGSEPESVR